MTGQMGQPIQTGQPCMEQTGQPIQMGQLCRCVTVSHLYLSLTKQSSLCNKVHLNYVSEVTTIWRYTNVYIIIIIIINV